MPVGVLWARRPTTCWVNVDEHLKCGDVIVKAAYLRRGLDLADSSQIVQNLEGQNIPYELVGDGNTILVPENQVSRLRMDIAAQGLNTGGSVGYEISTTNKTKEERG